MCVQDGNIRVVTRFLFALFLDDSLPAHAEVCECAHLTQAATVARYRHEGPQGAADDTVRPAEGGLLERAGVLVQEGVHAVGGGGASIPHEGL